MLILFCVSSRSTVVLDRFPETANGKLDKKALPDPADDEEGEGGSGGGGGGGGAIMVSVSLIGRDANSPKQRISKSPRSKFLEVVILCDKKCSSLLSIRRTIYIYI